MSGSPASARSAGPSARSSANRPATSASAKASAWRRSRIASRWPGRDRAVSEKRASPHERPGQPRLADKTAAQVRELVTNGRAGGHLFFATDACRNTYDELRAKGVEFTEEPTERPYGIDCALRDPFGNHIRFSQP